MRTIEDHKINPVNDILIITVMDEQQRTIERMRRGVEGTHTV